MKVLKSKGFTLAEMLIVMAVVVVLAAAALPKIGDTVEGAKESNDLSVIREAYTQAYTKAAADAADGSFDTTAYTITGLTFQQESEGWSFVKPGIAGVEDISTTDAGACKPTKTTTALKFTFTGTSLANIALSKVETETGTGTGD